MACINFGSNVSSLRGALQGLSECNERAREKANDSRKGAEYAKESVKMWRKIKNKKHFLATPDLI